MKTIIFLFVTASLFLGSCHKTDMRNGSDFDVKKYEAALNSDYSNAFDSHKALTGVSADSHIAHHSGPSQGSSANQLLAFTRNDSLFSEHFYEFCIKMVENGGMMSASGMMGNLGMGGDNGMMTGNMSDSQDEEEMIDMMKNMHASQSEMMNGDYFKIDSLMNAR